MKRHNTDALSLIFGLLFLSGGAWWAILQVLGASHVPVTLAVAITLVVVGAVGLATAVPRRRTSPPPTSQPAIPAEPVEATETDTAADLLKREDDTVASG